VTVLLNIETRLGFLPQVRNEFGDLTRTSIRILLHAYSDKSDILLTAVGLSMETGDFGGVRSQRYAMLVENGVVTQLNVEAPKTFEVSKAEVMLEGL